MKAVGGFLRGVRKARGLKPEEVALAMAHILGKPVSPATVYKIEGNRINLGLDKFMAILAALQADGRIVARLAVSNETAAQGEELGRQSVEGNDTTWLALLSPADQDDMQRIIDHQE